jgi:hypothetical protein
MFWAHYWDCDPCCYPDRSGDLRSITKVSSRTAAVIKAFPDRVA